MMGLRHKGFGLLLAVGAGAAATSAYAQFVPQGPKLIGNGAVGPALQGDSISLSADGNTVLVAGAWGQ